MGPALPSMNILCERGHPGVREQLCQRVWHPATFRHRLSSWFVLWKEITGFEKVVSNACLGFSPQDDEDLWRGFSMGVFQGEGN